MQSFPRQKREAPLQSDSQALFDPLSKGLSCALGGANVFTVFLMLMSMHRDMFERISKMFFQTLAGYTHKGKFSLVEEVFI